MKTCCAMFVLIGAAGMAAASAWWAAEQERVAPVAQIKGVVRVKTAVRAKPQAAHTAAPEMLNRTLMRLHNRALEYFYSDPRNGLARMPLVYEKVVKEWKTPWFSLGELDAIEPVPFKSDLEQIHASSMHDFVHPEEKTPIPEIFVTNFNRKFDEGKKFWEARNVDLIGLLEHPQPVAYVSEKLGDMHHADKTLTRPLDEFEIGGLAALQKGEKLFARSRDGVVRLLGAVRANADCLSCHDNRKEGDLLGAFSYTLRHAEYKRGPRKW